MQSTATVAAAAAVLPFAGSGTLAHQKAEGISDHAVQALWHQWREATFKFKADMAAWSEAYKNGAPDPYDPDPICNAFCDGHNITLDKIIALETGSADRAAVLILTGLIYTTDCCPNDCPADISRFETGNGLEALTALRPMLTGQIAADVGELLDNLDKPWPTFKWLQG